MSLELHWVSGSPYAWRVQLALEYKGLGYVSHCHQLSTGELKSPRYLALNPRGRVPTLVDGDFVLYESLAILAYLEQLCPEPALFGKNPRETGLVWRQIAEYTAYADRAGEEFIVSIYFGRALERREAVLAAASVLIRELDSWDRALGEKNFFVGDRPTAADFVIFPGVKSLERATGKEAARALGLEALPVPARWPRVAAWLQRIEALPGYEKTYPPHWR